MIDEIISSSDLQKATDATPRQLDHWAKKGVIDTLNKKSPGIGNPRLFNASIIPRVKLLVTLSNFFNGMLRTETLRAVYDNYENGCLEVGDLVYLTWRVKKTKRGV
jgi:DNA-binding transcriptional MerR regulator